jgi:hypothetical protein
MLRSYAMRLMWWKRHIALAGLITSTILAMEVTTGGLFVGHLTAQPLTDNTPPAPLRDLGTVRTDVQYPQGFFIPAYFALDQQNKNELNQKFDLIVAPRWVDVSGISSEKTLIMTAPSPCNSNSLGDRNEWNEISQHEDWFLHSSPTSSPETRIPMSNYTHLFYMDVGSQGWKDFVTSKYQKVIEDNPAVDGVFVDGPTDIDGYESLLGSAYPIYSASEYEAKALDFISAIKSAVGPNKIVILNANLEKSFTARADGNMAEGFVHFGGWENGRQATKEQWLSDIRGISGPESDEKYVLVGSGSLESTLPSMVEYCYASFLIAYNTNAHCYFYWHSNAEGGYSTINWFSLWELKIGEPLGDYVESSGLYRRNFTEGVALVNPNDVGEAKAVSLDGFYLNSVGSVVTSVILSNKSGVVLKKIE